MNKVIIKLKKYIQYILQQKNYIKNIQVKFSMKSAASNLNSNRKIGTSNFRYLLSQ